LELIGQISRLTAADSPTYIYCDSGDQLKKLEDHFNSFVQSKDEVSIYLDTEGRNLGRVNGKLGLVQLGIENEIYLVDVIVYPESLDLLRRIVHNGNVVKVVWDGRSDYAEFWHGHQIDMAPVLDLQLVHVHKNKWQRKYQRLDGMTKVFLNLPRAVQKFWGVNEIKLRVGLNPFGDMLKVSEGPR
jgi:3'-5' exonuclease